VDLSATIEIDRPPNEVFSYVMNVAHDAHWRTGVVEAAFTSEGEPRVGTTGYDKIDADGREGVATWTVFEFEPDSHARWMLDSGPIKGTGGYICDRSGNGTAFTLEAQVTPTGWYRLLGPVFGMIGRRQNEADVLKLKGILEQSA
jgi:uncharacterized protein YndB with AHSA1/START domain